MSNAIERYQQRFAAYFDAHYAFAFWKARVALYAMLKALGIGPGDEVILPGYTCVMDVNPIKYLGAEPVYVDIEPQTFNVNPDLVADKITDRTKLIIAQHTYGYTCDMDALMEIAAARNLPIIEDCCLALGSKYKGKLAGTFGKAAYFSSQWNKPYTTGLGGMAVTNDDKLAQNLREIAGGACTPSLKEELLLTAQLCVYRTLIYPATTAMAQNLFRYLTQKGVVVGSSATCEFQPRMAEDFLKLMSSIQARSGLKQLRRLDKNIAHRKQMARLYDRLLAGKGWPVRQYDPKVSDPVMVRYPVRIKEKQKAIAGAAKAGIELGTWFESPLHPAETPLAPYDYIEGMCPNAEKAAREVVNLPLHPRVSERVAKKTVDFVTSYTPA
jgi:perosamine synthetase